MLLTLVLKVFALSKGRLGWSPRCIAQGQKIRCEPSKHASHERPSIPWNWPEEPRTYRLIVPTKFWLTIVKARFGWYHSRSADCLPSVNDGDAIFSRDYETSFIYRHAPKFLSKPYFKSYDLYYLTARCTLLYSTMAMPNRRQIRYCLQVVIFNNLQVLGIDFLIFGPIYI